jgi:hypothetical protein
MMHLGLVLLLLTMVPLLVTWALKMCSVSNEK